MRQPIDPPSPRLATATEKPERDVRKDTRRSWFDPPERMTGAKMWEAAATRPRRRALILVLRGWRVAVTMMIVAFVLGAAWPLGSHAFNPGVLWWLAVYGLYAVERLLIGRGPILHDDAYPPLPDWRTYLWIALRAGVNVVAPPERWHRVAASLPLWLRRRTLSVSVWMRRPAVSTFAWTTGRSLASSAAVTILLWMLAHDATYLAGYDRRSNPAFLLFALALLPAAATTVVWEVVLATVVAAVGLFVSTAVPLLLAPQATPLGLICASYLARLAWIFVIPGSVLVVRWRQSEADANGWMQLAGERGSRVTSVYRDRPAAMFADLADLLVAAYPFAAVLIFVPDEDGRLVARYARVGTECYGGGGQQLVDRGFRMPRGVGLIDEVLRTGQSITTNNVLRARGHYGGCPELQWVRAESHHPLRLADPRRPEAVITLLAAQSRIFLRGECERIDALVQTYSAEMDWARHDARIIDLTASLARQHIKWEDVQHILMTAAVAVHEEVGAHVVSVAALRPGDDDAHIVVTCGDLNDPWVLDRAGGPDRPQMPRIAEALARDDDEARLVVVPDEERNNPATFAAREGIVQRLEFPLRANGVVVGIVFANYRERTDKLADWMCDRVQVAATFMALALARWFEEDGSDTVFTGLLGSHPAPVSSNGAGDAQTSLSSLAAVAGGRSTTTVTGDGWTTTVGALDDLAATASAPVPAAVAGPALDQPARIAPAHTAPSEEPGGRVVEHGHIGRAIPSGQVKRQGASIASLGAQAEPDQRRGGRRKGRKSRDDRIEHDKYRVAVELARVYNMPNEQAEKVLGKSHVAEMLRDINDILGGLGNNSIVSHAAHAKLMHPDWLLYQNMEARLYSDKAIEVGQAYFLRCVSVAAYNEWKQDKAGTRPESGDRSKSISTLALYRFLTRGQCDRDFAERWRQEQVPRQSTRRVDDLFAPADG